MPSLLNLTGWTAGRRDRLSERAAWLSCVALALILVWMLARTFWLLVPGDDGLAGGAPRELSVASSAPTISIGKWHLFGNAPQQLNARKNAPETTLSLSLRGTLADADPRTGIAVITDEQGAERAWRVGEEITPGVTLEEVYPDRVVILHAGTQEVLALQRNEVSARVEPIPAVMRGGAAPRNTAPSNNSLGVTSFEPPNLAHGALDWQKTMQSVGGGDASEMARNVRIDPVLNDGNITGVRVSAANGDPGLVAKLGLRPSDIVTAVNGVPVDSVARGQQILESLRNASSVRVTVTRDGKPAEIMVQLK
ncbi:type II secretion system protein N [Dokdonella sp.]|uniref:type II secretion system protein N n=1 Tax=Dokdonella sp. TaxID=2291710 RepID=UPI003527C668